MEMEEKQKKALNLVLESPFKRPNFYTTQEGGNWKLWPYDAPFDYSWLEKRLETAVIMGDLDVHSLAFGRITAGLAHFQRWDCREGFTSPYVRNITW